MGTVRYSHRLDQTAIRALLTSRQGPVVRDMLRRGLLVETQAKRNLGGGASGPKRVDTGRLRASINTAVVERGGVPVVVVGTNVQYAMFVHEGTGIYGPRGRRIRPVRRKALRFKPKSSRGRFVFARSVAGIRPNRFLTNALPAAAG